MDWRIRVEEELAARKSNTFPNNECGSAKNQQAQQQENLMRAILSLICMVNGTCVMKGGAKRKLSEGEVMTPAGDIFHAKGLTQPGAYFSRG